MKCGCIEGASIDLFDYCLILANLRLKIKANSRTRYIRRIGNLAERKKSKRKN